MSNLKLNILFCLMWIWQLPQHLLALILTINSKPKHILPAGVKLYTKKFIILPDLTLGHYIFINEKLYGNSYGYIRHLFGHFLQSFKLGPLFIPVIIIPALLWLWFSNDRNYMMFYTERWANKLARKSNRMKS